MCRARRFASSGLGGSGLLRLDMAPAATFTMHTAILLFPGYRRRALHTKNLIHWLAERSIVARKPAFTIQWTGIFMLAPI